MMMHLPAKEDRLREYTFGVLQWALVAVGVLGRWSNSRHVSISLTCTYTRHEATMTK